MASFRCVVSQCCGRVALLSRIVAVDRWSGVFMLDWDFKSDLETHLFSAIALFISVYVDISFQYGNTSIGFPKLLQQSWRFKMYVYEMYNFQYIYCIKISRKNYITLPILNTYTEQVFNCNCRSLESLESIEFIFFIKM